MKILMMLSSVTQLGTLVAGMDLGLRTSEPRWAHLGRS